MEITLTRQQQKVVEGMVKRGEFASPNKAIDAALKALRVKSSDEDLKARAEAQFWAGVREKVKDGLEQADAGKLIPGSVVFARLRRRFGGRAQRSRIR